MTREQEQFVIPTIEPVGRGQILPHGGRLINLVADQEAVPRLRKEAETFPFWVLTDHQAADLELLVSGGFSPLRGFLDQRNYQSVCETMRLSDGNLWPIPITLDVSYGFAASFLPEQRITLRHPEGMVLAVMTVTDVWEPDREYEARCVFGTSDTNHPGVFHLLDQTNPIYVGGRLEGLGCPAHDGFEDLIDTPVELRAFFEAVGWKNVVGFQTRNPIHHAHIALTQRAMEKIGAGLLIHPVIGPTQPGDLDPSIRVQCYRAVLPHYPSDQVKLSLLPLAMRMAGPREALWHAIVRKNFGCTHLVIGRDHAGPRNNCNGEAFYDPYAAQKLCQVHQEEIGIQILASEEMVYVLELGEYLPRSQAPKGLTVCSLSGSQLRALLEIGGEIPPWLSPPEVIQILQEGRQFTQ